MPYRTLHRFCVQELGFGRPELIPRRVENGPADLAGGRLRRDKKTT